MQSRRLNIVPRASRASPHTLNAIFLYKMLASISPYAYLFCVLILPSLLQQVLGLAPINGSTGCGIAHEPYQDGESRTYSVNSSGGGGIRQYNIHLPLQYNPNVVHPLMISYHGGTETMEEQEQLSQFSYNSVNPGMIAVYPQGINVGDEDLIIADFSVKFMSEN